MAFFSHSSSFKLNPAAAVSDGQTIWQHSRILGGGGEDVNSTYVLQCCKDDKLEIRNLVR